MAESAGNQQAAPIRYFCHMCNVETLPNADFTCPTCAGGFIEELPTAQPQSATNSNTSIGTSSSRSSTASNNLRRDLSLLREDLASLLVSRNGANIEISFDLEGNSNRPSAAGGSDIGSTNTANNANASSGPNVAGGRVRPQNFDRFDNVLMDVLQRLTLGDVDGLLGNSQLLFMGNPGDYAWGREGIDTIVTQLLNQMETSGPPPLTKEKIDDIPIEKISEDEVKNKMQCSVCWEDFKIEENVRRLPCTHIYHEDCIIPWLNLHNTCPICRTSLADKETEQQSTPVNSNQPRNPSTSGIRLTRSGYGGPATIRIRHLGHNNNQANNGSNATNQNTNSNTPNTGSSTSQGNNIFGFDDNNRNLDMDLD